MTFWDILLLPKSVYQRISGRRITLYIGILLMGLTDILLPDLFSDNPVLFSDINIGVKILKVVIILLFSFIMGVINVVIFSIPLCDLFKKFKKTEDAVEVEFAYIKMMKIYILAHLIVLPINLVFYFFAKDLTDQSSPMSLSMAAYALVFIMLWLNSMMTRAIRAIYSFQLPYARLVFIVVFIWSVCTGIAREYLLTHWVLPWVF